MMVFERIVDKNPSEYYYTVSNCHCTRSTANISDIKLTNAEVAMSIQQWDIAYKRSLTEKDALPPFNMAIVDLVSQDIYYTLMDISSVYTDTLYVSFFTLVNLFNKGLIDVAWYENTKIANIPSQKVISTLNEVRYDPKPSIRIEQEDNKTHNWSAIKREIKRCSDIQAVDVLASITRYKFEDMTMFSSFVYERDGYIKFIFKQMEQNKKTVKNLLNSLCNSLNSRLISVDNGSTNVTTFYLKEKTDVKYTMCNYEIR